MGCCQVKGSVGGRLTRQIIFLQQFNFQFEYRPGTSLGNSNSMSRVASTISEYSGSLESIGEALQKDKQFFQVIKALSDEVPLPSNIAPGYAELFSIIGCYIISFASPPSPYLKHNWLFLAAWEILCWLSSTIWQVIWEFTKLQRR